MSEAAIIEVFREEAKEVLQNLEEDLLALEEKGDDEVVNRLFRAFHTLKGSSGIAGFDSVSELTHAVESRLDKVRSGAENVSHELVDILLESVDWVGETLFGEGEDSQAKTILVERLRLPIVSELMANMISEKVIDHVYRVSVSFREKIFMSGIDPLIIIEDLCAAGEVLECLARHGKIPILSNMECTLCYLSWIIVIKTPKKIKDIEDVFLFVKDDNTISIDDITDRYAVKSGPEASLLGDILVNKGIISEKELDDVLAAQEDKNIKVGELVVKHGLATKRELDEALTIQDETRKGIESTTVRVDTLKLDSLMNLLGEIVIGQSGLSRLSDQMDDEKGQQLKNAIYALDRTTREFQQQIMSIRMIQIGPSFMQFKRFVRDMAKQCGKNIRLDIHGADTELDKTVVEKISDPLKHMIRNAIDHGIENPSDRAAAGKEAEGTITLEAYHQEGNVYIVVSDDGKGMDVEVIAKKAREKGLIRPGEEIPEDKVLEFIFMPGFSTSDSVGELSGRGVGMDVVKNNITELRGMVELSTVKGKGSRFQIKLPLTMAIVEGMLCRVGCNIYVIPLLSIVESIRPVKEDVKTIEGKGEVVHVRGEYVSLVRLYQYYGVSSDYQNPHEALLIIVESSGVKLAVMVDDLVGQQQVVIKSLDNNITSDKSVSGAAIMGDGSVALIVDIHGLLSGFGKR